MFRAKWMLVAVLAMAILAVPASLSFANKDAHVDVHLTVNGLFDIKAKDELKDVKVEMADLRACHEGHPGNSNVLVYRNGKCLVNFGMLSYWVTSLTTYQVKACAKGYLQNQLLNDVGGFIWLVNKDNNKPNAHLPDCAKSKAILGGFSGQPNIKTGGENQGYNVFLDFGTLTMMFPPHKSGDKYWFKLSAWLIH